MINYQGIGKQRIHLTKVDSTNNYTKELVRQSVIASGIVVSAGFQSVGKGQRGNSWEGEPDKNVFSSCFIRFNSLSVERHFDINRWASLSVYETVCRWIPRNKVHIKWPNDIFIGKNKVAGILSENALNSSKVEASIVGIGLNVNQRKFTEHRATSLSQYLGEQDFCLETVYYELFKQLRDNGAMLVADASRLREKYDALLFLKNQKARFREEESSFEGAIRGTNLKGQLLVEVGNEVRQFDIQRIRYQL